MIIPSRQRRRIVVVSVLVASLIGPPSARAQQDPYGPAVAYLESIISEPTAHPIGWAALRARADRDFLPVLDALSRSANRENRLLATATVADVADEDAADILRQRVHDETVETIRAEALAQLIRLRAAGDRDCRAALASADPMVRCLAARALADIDPDLAIDVLTELTRHDEPAVAAPAHAALVKLGRPRHLKRLRALLAAEETDKQLRRLLLMQIADEQIAAAEDLVRQVARSEQTSDELRLQAYRTLAAINPQATKDLLAAVRESTRVVMGVRLLALLAAQPEGPAAVEDLLDDPREAVRILAGLELARLADEPDAARAALTAVALGHPIVLEYVLAVVRDDLDHRGRRARCYVPALWRIIELVPERGRNLTADHFFAAQAATLLADIGDADSLRRLEEDLAAPYGAKVRAIAAGLMRSRNPAACDLMVPLLDSPYDELAIDAAIALGSHRDTRGNGALREIIDHADRYDPATVAVACWYLLKNTDQAPAAAAQLARAVR